MNWIDRSIHEPGGIGYLLRNNRGLPPLEVPRDVAGWRRDMSRGRYADAMEVVTWDMVMTERRAMQRQILDRKRAVRQGVRPAALWVFFVPGWLYAGWHCYVVDLRSRWAWPDAGKGACRAGMVELMRRLPLGVLPLVGNEDHWFEAFVKTYPRRKREDDPRQAGWLAGWTSGTAWFATKEEAENA